MIIAEHVLKLHADTVARWHQEAIDNPYAPPLDLVCREHAFNYRLWHEEDIARSRDVSDAAIARVKRNIDQFNQQRNDCIESIDDWISAWLADIVQPDDQRLPLNSETPGSIIDRLSILALRIYHLEEQCERRDVDAAHLDSVGQKLAICREQRDDLAESLQQLLYDLRDGRKRHKTYRQFKMYNDPSLNPYLYGRPKKAG